MTEATRKDLEQDAADRRIERKLDAIAADLGELRRGAYAEIGTIKAQLDKISVSVETLGPIERALERLRRLVSRE